MTVPVSIIVAVARNGVIGADNKLIWRLKTDLKRFKALTSGKPLILGRKTLQSIGKALPGRDMIVVTRDPTFAMPGVRVVHSLAAALAEGEEIAARTGASEIMIGGGGEIYQAALPLAGRLYVTLVDVEPAGDAFFPPIAADTWRVARRVEHSSGVDDEAAFSFIDYVRR